MGVRKREGKPLRPPHGFHRHQREEQVRRVEKRETQVVLCRVFKVRSGSEFLEIETQ